MRLNVYFRQSFVIRVLNSSFFLPTPATHPHTGKPSLSQNCHHVPSILYVFPGTQIASRPHQTLPSLCRAPPSLPDLPQAEISCFLICVPTNLEQPSCPVCSPLAYDPVSLQPPPGQGSVLCQHQVWSLAHTLR